MAGGSRHFPEYIAMVDISAVIRIETKDAPKCDRRNVTVVIVESRLPIITSVDSYRLGSQL